MPAVRDAENAATAPAAVIKTGPTAPFAPAASEWAISDPDGSSGGSWISVLASCRQRPNRWPECPVGRCLPGRPRPVRRPRSPTRLARPDSRRLPRAGSARRSVRRPGLRRRGRRSPGAVAATRRGRRCSKSGDQVIDGGSVHALVGPPAGSLPRRGRFVPPAIARLVAHATSLVSCTCQPAILRARTERRGCSKIAAVPQGDSSARSGHAQMADACRAVRHEETQGREVRTGDAITREDRDEHREQVGTGAICLGDTAGCAAFGTGEAGIDPVDPGSEVDVD